MKFSNKVISFAAKVGSRAISSQAGALPIVGALFEKDAGHEAYVIAPSRAPFPGELEQTAKHLRDMGFEPKFSAECYAAPTKDNRAGTVGQRADGIAATFRAIAEKQGQEAQPKRVLISPIGGRGGSEDVLMEFIKRGETLPPVNGVFKAFSCSTSFLNSPQIKMDKLHASMIGDDATGLTPAPTLKANEDRLFNANPTTTFSKLKAGNEAAAEEGKIVEGVLAGGNLQVLNNGIGTYTPPNHGKIVLVEQVGEDHGIRRHFNLAIDKGLFNGAQAVVVGQLAVLGLPQAKKLKDATEEQQGAENARAKAEQEKIKSDLNEGIKELFAEKLPHLPLVMGLEIGHGFKSGVIMMDKLYTLKLGKSPELNEVRERETWVQRTTAVAEEKTAAHNR